MPIFLECEFCGKKYRFSDDRAGQTLPCKECGNYLELPGRKRPSSPGRRIAPASKDSFDTRTAVMVAAAAGAFVVAVILVLVLFRSRPDPKPDAPAEQLARNQQPQPQRNQRHPRPNVHPRPNFHPRPNRNPGVVRPPSNRQAPTPVTQPGVSKPAASGFQPAPGFQPVAGSDRDALAKPRVWNVAVDPAPVSADELKGKKVRIPLSSSVSEVAFGEHGSRFFALRGSQAIEVWDADAEKRVASLGTGNIFLFRTVLSADGAFVAAPAKVETANGIVVWDVKQKKPLGQLALPPPGMPGYLTFAVSQRLIAEQSGSLYVWALPSGDLEHTLQLPSGHQQEGLAVSPGGKYLAVCARAETRSAQGGHPGRLVVYDLATTDVAGDVLIPSEKFLTPRCAGLSFSPNGAELAGIFEFGSNAALIVWDVATGEMRHKHAYSRSLRSTIDGAFSHRGAVLEWFPNNERLLLYGHGLVNRDDGRLLNTLPSLSRGARHVLTDGRLLTANLRGSDSALVSATLSEDDLAQLEKTIASGGKAVDTGLPPLTSPDLSALLTVPLDAVGGSWKVTADPAPQQEERLLGKALQLKARSARMERLMLSSAASGRAVIMNVAQQTSRSPSRHSSSSRSSSDNKSPLWLDVYDLRTSRPVGNVDIPVPSDLLAVSPDGQFALMRLQPGQDRLDVWNLDDGAHVVGWRPYPPQQSGQQGTIVLNSSRTTPTEQRIDAAVFLDSDHVLTLSASKRIVLWKLPECKAIYAVDKTSTPGISPGNTYLVIANGNSFRFFRSRTGEPCGDLQSAGTLNAVAFHPDGKRFAVSFSGRYGGSLLCWDLSAGTILKEFPLPLVSTSMHWCGDNYLLMGGRTLVDVERGMVVWKYELANGIHAPLTPDDRHWFLGKKLPQSPAVYLSAVSLPDSAAAAAIAAADPKPKYLVQPGGRMSLQLQLLKPPGRPKFDEEVREKIVTKLAENGVTIADGQPVTALISMTTGSTGKSNQYSSTTGIFHRPSGPTTTVAERYVDCSIQFVFQNKTIWDEKRRFLNNSSYVRLEENQSLDQELNKRMWSSATSFMLSLSPPAYVFPEGAADGLGTSVLMPPVR